MNKKLRSFGLYQMYPRREISLQNAPVDLKVDVLWWLSKAMWTLTLNYSFQMSRISHARDG